MIRNFTLTTTRIYLVVQVKPNSPVGQLSGSIPEAGPHAKQRSERHYKLNIALLDKVWTRLRSDLIGTSQPLATVTIPKNSAIYKRNFNYNHLKVSGLPSSSPTIPRKAVSLLVQQIRPSSFLPSSGVGWNRLGGFSSFLSTSTDSNPGSQAASLSSTGRPNTWERSSTHAILESSKFWLIQM